MFQNTGSTSFDLRWTMFGFDVRVHPMFWLLTAYLGYIFIGSNLVILAVWVGCVFVSILLHELGHAVVGRIFGLYGHIVLMGMGGLTIWSANSPHRWQRVLITCGGPSAQLVMVPLLLYALVVVPRGVNPLAHTALSFLFYINLYWPLINLLPIYPMDGGQITREGCEWVGGRQGTKASLLISMLLAGFLAADVAWPYFFGRPLQNYVNLPVGPLMAFFFVMMIFNNYQEFSRISALEPRRYDDDDDNDRPSYWNRGPRHRDEDLPWERPEKRVRRESDEDFRRGSDDGFRRGPDEGHRRRDDNLPWER